MIKNSLIDLYREYVRCADMCEAYNEEHRTEVKPRDCVQLKSATGEWVGYFSLNEPNFAELLDHKVGFAVAIIEGRPVFHGDPIWVINNPHPVNWSNYKYWACGIQELSKDRTWEPPKKPRTFTLNGVELPCPIRNQNGYILRINDHPDGHIFMFKTLEQRDTVRDAILSVLEQASRKE